MIWELFYGFFRVGLFSFGGAYAAIPLVRDITMEYAWLSEEQLTYMIAVSESTPGPIMVNLATYVGNSQAGLLGSIIATFAVVIPSFLLILLLAALFTKAVKHPLTQSLLKSIKPSVIGIVCATGLFMILKQTFGFSAGSGLQLSSHLPDILLTALLALLYFGTRPILKKKKLSPLHLIGLSAILGLVFFA